MNGAISEMSQDDYHEHVDESPLPQSSPYNAASNDPSELTPVEARHRSLAVWAIFSSMFLDAMLMTFPIPFLSVLLADDGATSYQIGILYGSKAALQIIINPLLGVTVNRFGPKPLLLLGTVVIILSTVAFVLVPIKMSAYYYLLVARSIQGIASSCAFVAGASFIAAAFSTDAERGEAMGNAMVGYGLAAIVGPIAGGLLYTAGGKDLPFIVVSGVSVLQLVWLVYVFIINTKDERKFEQGTFPTFLETLTSWTDPYVLTVCVAIIIVNAQLGMVEFLLPVYLEDAFDPSTIVLGLIFLPSTAGYALTTPIVGRYGQTIGRYTIIAFGLILLAVVMMVFTLPRTLWLAMCMMLPVGVGLGCIDGSFSPVLAGILDQRHPTHSGYGIVFAMADLSIGIGYVLGAFAGSAITSALNFTDCCRIFAALSFVWAPLLYLTRLQLDSTKDDYNNDKQDKTKALLPPQSPATHANTSSINSHRQTDRIVNGKTINRPSMDFIT